MEQPITRHHERFGTLTFDNELGKYEANIIWVGSSVRLTLYAVKDADLQAALHVAEQLWEHQKQWNERVETYAVEKLLDWKNTVWLENDEDKLTFESFKSRISLESIGVDPNGLVSFWYVDGDLFFGHSIHVKGSLQNGVTNARVEG